MVYFIVFHDGMLPLSGKLRYLLGCLCVCVCGGVPHVPGMENTVEVSGSVNCVLCPFAQGSRYSPACCEAREKPFLQEQNRVGAVGMGRVRWKKL